MVSSVYRGKIINFDALARTRTYCEPIVRRGAVPSSPRKMLPPRAFVEDENDCKAACAVHVKKICVM